MQPFPRRTLSNLQGLYRELNRLRYCTRVVSRAWKPKCGLWCAFIVFRLLRVFGYFATLSFTYASILELSSSMGGHIVMPEVLSFFVTSHWHIMRFESTVELDYSYTGAYIINLLHSFATEPLHTLIHLNTFSVDVITKCVSLTSGLPMTYTW
jgi:hypothetical protein